ncbi:hypothetical protein GEMRC1_002656 [Eukaryota sp. GEM-RC1]
MTTAFSVTSMDTTSSSCRLISLSPAWSVDDDDEMKSCNMGCCVLSTEGNTSWIRDLSVDGDIELNPGPPRSVRGSSTPPTMIDAKIIRASSSLSHDTQPLRIRKEPLRKQIKSSKTKR